jgi:hypothetical protein
VTPAVCEEREFGGGRGRLEEWADGRLRPFSAFRATPPAATGSTSRRGGGMTRGSGLPNGASSVRARKTLSGTNRGRKTSSSAALDPKPLVS